MNDKVAKSEPTPPRAIGWPRVVVTLLVGAFAVGLVVVQFVWANNPESQLALANLNQRVPFLESVTNWVQRDSYCVPLSAFARDLDVRLAPDARVFVSGMLGPTNLSKAGYYYFLKNYLFPREVEISLDGKSTSGSDGFSGVPCDSPEVVRSNGFDLMIQFTDNRPGLIPLTPKGVPRSE